MFGNIYPARELQYKGLGRNAGNYEQNILAFPVSLLLISGVRKDPVTIHHTIIPPGS